MAKVEKLAQCRFVKPISDTSEMVYHAYIPEKYAKVGKILDIEIDDKVVEGLYVDKVYTILPAKVVYERSQDYKNTRKASDI